MPTLKESAQVAGTSELLSLFIISVKRAAHAIVQNPASTDPLKAWAKRVYGDPGSVGRAEWYASRMLEGAIFESPGFIDAALAQGPITTLPDATVNQVVDTWAARFAAQAI